jgi:hypothetical protein
VVVCVLDIDTQVYYILLLLCILITVCDQGTFGEECKSRCHCLNGVGCNNVNGQCPRGDCDAGNNKTINVAYIA